MGKYLLALIVIGLLSVAASTASASGYCSYGGCRTYNSYYSESYYPCTAGYYYSPAVYSPIGIGLFWW